jgi:hypothetical protein
MVHVRAGDEGVFSAGARSWWTTRFWLRCRCAAAVAMWLTRSSAPFLQVVWVVCGIMDGSLARLVSSGGDGAHGHRYPPWRHHWGVSALSRSRSGLVLSSGKSLGLELNRHNGVILMLSLRWEHCVWRHCMSFLVAFLQCSSLSKVDRRWALCTTSPESPRQRLYRDRARPAIFSFDGALTRRVHVDLLSFGGDRRGARRGFDVQLRIASFVSWL